MKNLAALTMMTAFLCLSGTVAGNSAPLAPVGPAGALIGAESSSIEDVRWVKRCRNVRVIRHGRRVTVQRCSRVWVRPHR